MGKNNKQKQQHASNNNGNNIPKPKNKKIIKPEAKKSQKWSCCALMSMFIFAAIITTLLTTVYVCADGDISTKGIQKALPIVNQNFQKMVNVTIDKVKSGNYKELWSSTVSGTTVAWKALVKHTTPLIEAVSKYMIIGWNSLQTVTGDLSPYTDAFVHRMKELYIMVSKATLYIIGHITNYISTADLNKIKTSILWLWTAFIEQLYVLREEIARNQALNSFWKDMQPYRDSFWAITAVAREQFWEVCAHAQNEWIPLVKNQTITYFNLAKDSVMKLM